MLCIPWFRPVDHVKNGLTNGDPSEQELPEHLGGAENSLWTYF